jgi:hypothetical protein
VLDALAFVMRRATRYWQVLVTLSVGVILATALLASAPLLINTVIEFGMRRTLLDADPMAVNLRLILRAEPDVVQYRDLHSAVQDLVYGYLGAQLDRTVPSGSTRWAFPWVDGELLPDRRVNVRFYDRAYGSGTPGVHERATLVYGYWPTDHRPEQTVVAAVIGEGMAKAYDLAAGDRLALSLRESADEPDLWIEVAGIVRPADAHDRYWFGTLSPLRSQHSAHYQSQFGVLVSPEAFFEAAGDLVESLPVELSWNILLDPAAIVLEDIPHLRAVLVAMAEDAVAIDDGLRVETELDATLAAYTMRSEAVRAPLYFLTATVMLLALYYVTMDAALSLRQFQREFAVLGSRGASGWQLFRVQLLEALLVVVIALLAGPGLALSITRALVVLGPLADVGETDWMLWLPRASWIAALLGAAACMASLLLPVPSALRRSIVTHQQSLARANRPPWWQRFYVDVFVLLVGLVLIWRLRLYGSLLGGSPVRPQVDWLLLLSPLALLLGSATILLRVFPLLLDAAARLVSRGRGLPATLALLQAARDPTHIARLVLLLTLAMALGLFSTGLNATLDRNERDQSYYSVGGDLQLVDPPFDLDETLLSLPGVQAVAKGWRDQGTIAVQVADGYPTFDLIAVEPEAFGQVARFRSDFAERPMPELLGKLAVEAIPQPTLILPGYPDTVGVWLWLPEQSRPIAGRISVEAKLQTPGGMLFSFRLRLARSASEPDDGWYYYEGRPRNKQHPLELHSLWFRNPVPSYQNRIYQLGVGNLVVTDVGTDQVVVQGFAEAHLQVYGHLATAQTDQMHPDAAGAVLQLDFDEDSGMRTGVWYGVYRHSERDIDPLPALISPAFRDIARVDVGDRIGTWVNSQPVEFEIVDMVHYFPTMYEEGEAGFLVTAFEPLVIHLNGVSPRAAHMNRVYVATTEPGELPSPFAASLPDLETLEAETVRRAIKADPLALGLRSVTLFGYALTTLLSLAGFGTHFYMSTRQHGRTYVVLRALGFSPQQLYGMLLFEQSLLIFSGLALGTVLGLLLNRLTLPGLPLSLGGRPPVPPFLAETDWWAVVRIYVTLAVAFLVALGVATWLLWRTKLHQLLRVDEE